MGILIGALLYREITKRFFSERSIPLSIVIEQSVIRDKVSTLMNLVKIMSNTVIQIQEEIDAIFSQLNRIADMEDVSTLLEDVEEEIAMTEDVEEEIAMTEDLVELNALMEDEEESSIQTEDEKYST